MLELAREVDKTLIELNIKGSRKPEPLYIGCPATWYPSRDSIPNSLFGLFGFVFFKSIKKSSLFQDSVLIQSHPRTTAQLTEVFDWVVLGSPSQLIVIHKTLSVQSPRNNLPPIHKTPLWASQRPTSYSSELLSLTVPCRFFKEGHTPRTFSRRPLIPLTSFVWFSYPKPGIIFLKWRVKQRKEAEECHPPWKDVRSSTFSPSLLLPVTSQSELSNANNRKVSIYAWSCIFNPHTQPFLLALKSHCPARITSTGE